MYNFQLLLIYITLKVIWYAGDQEIHDKELFEVQQADSAYSLQLTEVNMEHEGEYTVVASNEHGKVESSASVTVAPSEYLSCLLVIVCLLVRTIYIIFAICNLTLK